VHRRTRRTIAVAALSLGAVALAACSSTSTGDDADARDAAGTPSSGVVDQAGNPVETMPGNPTERSTRSSGCDQGTTITTGTDEEVTVDANGTPRTYIRHVPPAATGSTALPVVVDLHGYQEGAKIHTAMSAMGPFGDTKGFITITPQGEGQIPRWIAESGSDDVAFIGNVLDDVESTLCVDLDRVYVTGLSNGAFMTSALACDMADRFAAAAPVAGISDIEGCSPSRPVPVIAFHGTEDTFIAYGGGMGPSALSLPAPDGSGRTLGDIVDEGGNPGNLEGDGASELPEVTGPSIPDITSAWAARNGCESTPTESPVAGDVTKLTFACPAGAEVELYRVDGGGHTWPGSEFSSQLATVMGVTTMSISANEVMWEFFQAHPMAA
jgi:polyhydroxybutyrate depolymerase